MCETGGAVLVGCNSVQNKCQKKKEKKKKKESVLISYFARDRLAVFGRP